MTGGLDLFRVIAALLVVANHTSPLAFAPQADYVLVQIFSRLTVPFFFMVTGYFVLPRLEHASPGPVLKKAFLLYALALLLYLPLNLYKGLPNRPVEWLRFLLFDGTFYHLWYFSALLLGLGLMALLVRRPRWVLPVAGLVYLLGLTGDSYYGLGLLRGAWDGVFPLLGQARNGPFLALPFLVLGWVLAKHPPRLSRRQYAVGTLLALGCLLAEGLMVQRLELARYSVLYLSLPPAAWFLFRWLLALELPERPGLRPLSTAIYLLHPWVIVLVRGFAKLTGTVPLLVEQPLVHFFAVALSTALLGGFVCLCRQYLPSRYAGKRSAPDAAGPKST